MTVRRARAEDVDAIARLVRQLRGESRAHHRPVARDEVARFLRGDRAMFLAEGGGKPVGMVALQRRPRLGYEKPELWISDMVVDGRWRRRGVGRALAEAAEALARRWGCGTVRLESREHREEAHAFYGSVGYGEHGVSFEKVL